MGLAKRFRRVPAIEDMDLDVPEGAIYALLGPHGAGKTTLVRTLLNVLEPSAGRAEVLGVDSRRLGPREFARMAYLAADQELPETMTAGHYLRFLRGFYPTWDLDLESKLVRRFQLLLDWKFARLSEAARRKAALVSSLACRPALMALDDPFRDIDAVSRDEMLAAVLENAQGATIMLCAEEAGEVEVFATHIGWIEKGRLRLSESLESLRARCLEVVLTFDEPPAMPVEWPAAWSAPESRGAVVRFLDTQFDVERTTAEVHKRWPGIREAAANPAGLAEILAVLARGWRTR